MISGSGGAQIPTVARLSCVDGVFVCVTALIGRLIGTRATCRQTVNEREEY